MLQSTDLLLMPPINGASSSVEISKELPNSGLDRLSALKFEKVKFVQMLHTFEVSYARENQSLNRFQKWAQIKANESGVLSVIVRLFVSLFSSFKKKLGHIEFMRSEVEMTKSYLASLEQKIQLIRQGVNKKELSNSAATKITKTFDEGTLENTSSFTAIVASKKDSGTSLVDPAVPYEQLFAAHKKMTPFLPSELNCSIHSQPFLGIDPLSSKTQLSKPQLFDTQIEKQTQLKTPILETITAPKRFKTIYEADGAESDEESIPRFVAPGLVPAEFLIEPKFPAVMPSLFELPALPVPSIPLEQALIKVSQNGLELAHFPDFQNNQVLVLAAVTQNGLALQFASSSLQGLKSIVEAAVKQNGLALQWAPLYSGNSGMVTAALKQNGLALPFVSSAMAKSRAYIRLALEQNPFALKLVHPSMNSDFKLTKLAVSKNGLALAYAAPCLQDNQKLVLVAIAQNGLALKFASEKLRALPAVYLLAIAQTAEAARYVI